MRYGQLFQADKQTQGLSLFGDDDPTLTIAGRPPVNPALPWIDAYKLEKERDLVGIFHSAHPLDGMFLEMKYGLDQLKDYKTENVTRDRVYTYGGIVIGLDRRQGQNGSSYGYLKIEDYNGTAEIYLNDKSFYQFANFGIPNTAVYVKGQYGLRKDGNIFFSVADINLLSNLKGKLIRGITITLDPEQLNTAVYDILQRHDGLCRRRSGRRQIITRTAYRTILRAVGQPLYHHAVHEQDQPQPSGSKRSPT